MQGLSSNHRKIDHPYSLGSDVTKLSAVEWRHTEAQGLKEHGLVHQLSVQTGQHFIWRHAPNTPIFPHLLTFQRHRKRVSVSDVAEGGWET